VTKGGSAHEVTTGSLNPKIPTVAAKMNPTMVPSSAASRTRSLGLTGNENTLGGGGRM
jgi:hypothetical protein